jgi:hypothetical protein
MPGMDFLKLHAGAGRAQLFTEIDARYGGLAAPRSVDLAARIDVVN